MKLKNSLFALALGFSILGAHSGTALAGGACGIGEVTYRHSKNQVLSTPVGWTMVEDMDDDGQKDLIGIDRVTLTTAAASNIIFYKRTASGYVTAPVVSSLGASFVSHGMITGDLNGDGDLDLLNFNTVAGSNPATFTAYYGDGSGGFTAGATSSIAYQMFNLALGDLDGDGKDDLVTARSAGTGYHLTQGDGTFGAFVSVNTVPTAVVKTADFDANGKVDILSWNFDNSSSRTHYNQGGGTFNAVTIPGLHSTGPRPDHIADVNGDGRLDIVSSGHYAQSSNQQAVSVYLGEPGGSFVKTEYILASLRGAQNQRTVLTDADGDGDLDVVLEMPKSYHIGRNNGAGNLNDVTAVNTTLQPGAHVDGVGDPAADIVAVARPGIFHALSDSVNFWGSVCGKTGRTKFVDYDGDGDTDLGYFRASDGTWSNRNSRIGGGGGPSAYTNISGFGTVSDITAPQDFNGDGLTDRAFFRPSTGTWTIKDSATNTNSDIQWGANGDKPVPSDYDGDGKADLAVYRPSNGSWWILNSSNGSYSVYSFGVSEDIPVAMDYDGDGLSDIAVFRPSTGMWFIQKSTGGYYIHQYGITGDRPVPGDYDNDGSADIAIFRDGQWHVLRLRDNALAFRLWGQAGDVPMPFDHVGRNWGANFAVYRPSFGWMFEMDNESQIHATMLSNPNVSTILPAN